MKKRAISFFLIAILILTLSIAVFASNETRTAELAFRNIKITLNGKELTPKDISGNVVEPFIIDGTTYLPVRAVADALGLNVEWDGTNSTVKLSDPMLIQNLQPTFKEDNQPDNIHLKVCSFNAGLYNYGRSSATRPYINEKDAAVREFIGANDFDILACQENSRLDTTDSDTRYAYVDGFNWFYAGSFLLTVASKYPITNARTGQFSNGFDGGYRGWLIVDVTIGDKIIAVANTHPEWRATEEGAEVRALQNQELINMLKGYDYVIIFGDFNAVETSEFDIFKNAGYTLSNGGYLPFDATSPAIEPVYARDNIIVKSPSPPTCFRTVLAPVVADLDETPEDETDAYVSDHLPIMATINMF